MRNASSCSCNLAALVDLLFLVLPLGGELGALLAQIGEFLLDAREALPAGGVLLLLEGLPLHLELHDLAVEFVDLRRLGIEFHLEPRGRLVHEVHRLVRQEAVGDVAVRKDGGGHQRGILDADVVVRLVPLLEAAQDGDGILDARLIDHDGLEAALERRVLLDVLAVLIQRRRADGAQLPARELRLEHV